jgi:queuine tRNA-ribosyltransferase
MLGPELNSLHNVHYYLQIMDGLRSAIETGTLDSFVGATYEGWGITAA